MAPHENRPYALKSTEELAVIAEWLEREREAVEGELRARTGEQYTSTALYDRGLRGAGETPRVLAYRALQTRLAVMGLTGDSYAEEARSYAMRVALIGLAVVGVIAAACVGLGLMH